MAAARRNLAALRLRHGSRLDQHDVIRGHADSIDRGLPCLGAQRFARTRLDNIRLSQHDDAFRAGAWIGNAEHGHGSPANPGNIADRILDFVRIDVLTGPDDDVLDAPGDEDLAAGQIAAISGVEPIVVKQLPRLGLVLKIAGSCGWAAELQPSFAPLADRPTDVIDHADFMFGNRLAAADDLHHIDGIRIRFRNSAPAERLTADPVDDGWPARSRQSNGHRILCQPIDRRHRLRPKAIGPKSLGKSA